MKILRSIKSTQTISSKLRSQSKIIGFVPTMGYLHDGHISLINTARKNADFVFVSIYVNPLQFGPTEDYKKYPRNLKRDEKLCKDAGVDYIFYPSDKEMYKINYSSFVNIENITSILEGAIRPGHFKGVATVCMKLFNIINPNFAVFGQKDAQQVAVVKKMVAELNMNLKVITGETKREPGGLAMSSRNVYLNQDQRKDAAVLFKALSYAKRKISDSRNRPDLPASRDIEFLSHQMYKLIKSRPSVTKIDYISFNNNMNLEPVKSLKNLKKNDELLISLAVRFSNIRLIDNIVIKY
jgi:pantoate--beta-alanine ligase